MGTEPTRATILRHLENLAEHLTAQQLDLIVQVEGQLRAVHHTMRRISTLRAIKHREGDQITNGERRVTLRELAEEIDEIETLIDLQGDTSREMNAVVKRMQEAAADLRLVAERLKTHSDEPAASADQSTDADT